MIYLTKSQRSKAKTVQDASISYCTRSQEGSSPINPSSGTPSLSFNWLLAFRRQAGGHHTWHQGQLSHYLCSSCWKDTPWERRFKSMEKCTIVFTCTTYSTNAHCRKWLSTLADTFFSNWIFTLSPWNALRATVVRYPNVKYRLNIGLHHGDPKTIHYCERLKENLCSGRGRQSRSECKTIVLHSKRLSLSVLQSSGLCVARWMVMVMANSPGISLRPPLTFPRSNVMHITYRSSPDHCLSEDNYCTGVLFMFSQTWYMGINGRFMGNLGFHKSLELCKYMRLEIRCLEEIDGQLVKEWRQTVSHHLKQEFWSCWKTHNEIKKCYNARNEANL